MSNPLEILHKGYRVINKIGQGGLATTYLAENTETNQNVAIKVLSLHQVSDWKVLELFEREAKVLANLNHSGIPAYIDYFTDDSESDRHFYLVQELAIGESLDKLIVKGWKPDEAELREIG